MNHKQVKTTYQYLQKAKKLIGKNQLPIIYTFDHEQRMHDIMFSYMPSGKEWNNMFHKIKHMYVEYYSLDAVATLF